MFAIRTVKDGRVKIKGKYFYPPSPYDGRFEKKRFAFGLYRNYSNSGVEGIENYCQLWGTESEYKTFCMEDTPIYVEDSIFKWMFWRVK